MRSKPRFLSLALTGLLLAAAITFAATHIGGLVTKAGLTPTSKAVSATSTPPSSARLGADQREVSSITTELPSIFRDYNVLFEGGASNDTSISAIRSRLRNTFIQIKSTGEKLSLMSALSSGSPLLSEAEVVGNTLYVGINSLAPEYPGWSTDLWTYQDGDQSARKLFSHQFIQWFSISGDGRIALADDTGHLIFLDGAGRSIQTVDEQAIGFCGYNGGTLIAWVGWFGDDFWAYCPATTGPYNSGEYLEINADTFQMKRNAPPPPQAGLD